MTLEWIVMIWLLILVTLLVIEYLRRDTRG